MERSVVQHVFRTARILRSTPPYRFPRPSNCSHVQQKRFRNTDSNDNQAYPLTGYWADVLGNKKDLLDKPKEEIQPATRTAPEPPPPEPLPKTDKEETIERARIVFGSKLAGPTQHREEINKVSQNVAGVLVPPKPEEPDDCCMSGCVNCVWDIYRDDLEEWAAKSAQAREKIQAQRSTGEATGTMNAESNTPTHVATSMDDDGGGSDTNWTDGVDLANEKKDLFENIPVGIREFMRTEKMLKQKHTEDGSTGG